MSEPPSELVCAVDEPYPASDIVHFLIRCGIMLSIREVLKSFSDLRVFYF